GGLRGPRTRQRCRETAFRPGCAVSGVTEGCRFVACVQNVNRIIMTGMRRFAAFFVALVLGLLGSLAVRAQQGGTQPAAGTQQPADQTELTFRAGINFVTVDAYVSDSKGQPVTDLKQTDFEIQEDNKPQKIEQFRFIKVDGNPKPGEPPP